MAVKINMKMPKRCWKCKFYEHSYNMVFERCEDTCTVERSYIFIDPQKTKPDWCPLKEIKE